MSSRIAQARGLARPSCIRGHSSSTTTSAYEWASSWMLRPSDSGMRWASQNTSASWLASRAAVPRASENLSHTAMITRASTTA